MADELHRRRRSRPPVLRAGSLLVASGAAGFAALVFLLPPSRTRTVAALLVPIATLVALAVRWLRDRSLPSRTRAVGAGIGFAAAIVLGVVPPLSTGVIALLWGLPVAMGLAFAVFAGLWHRRPAVRRWVVGITLLAAVVPWLSLRLHGASGQMMPNLVWVWRSPGERAPSIAPAAGTPALEIPVEALAEDWPGYRGGSRGGVVAAGAASTLDLDWRLRPPRERWRRAVEPGWSAFAVVGDLACTQDQAAEMERVVCLDARDGRTVWAHAEHTRFEELAGGPGPRATPLIDRGRVYALGASGTLNCLDARSGEVIWSADISGPAGETPEWGFASSPVLHEELVYVSPAGVGGVRMLALDRTTGTQVWRGEGEHAGYGSPQLAVIAGLPQVLLFDGGGLVSYDAATGDVLWEHVWPTELPRAAQPLVIGEAGVVIGMGYGRGVRSLEVQRDGDDWRVRESWSSSSLKPKFNSFVEYEGNLYGLDEGILVSLDAGTGKRLWKGGRYGYGQLALVGTMLLVVSESGELVLVEASPTGHRERFRMPALTGKTWNHPAISRGRLFVRNGSEAARYELPRIR